MDISKLRTSICPVQMSPGASRPTCFSAFPGLKHRSVQERKKPRHYSPVENEVHVIYEIQVTERFSDLMSRDEQLSQLKGDYLISIFYLIGRSTDLCMYID